MKGDYHRYLAEVRSSLCKMPYYAISWVSAFHLFPCSKLETSNKPTLLSRSNLCPSIIMFFLFYGNSSRTVMSVRNQPRKPWRPTPPHPPLPHTIFPPHILSGTSFQNVLWWILSLFLSHSHLSYPFLSLYFTQTWLGSKLFRFLLRDLELPRPCLPLSKTGTYRQRQTTHLIITSYHS